MKSIRAKLTMFTTLLVVISLSLVTVISYWEAKSTIMKNTEESVSIQSVTASKQVNLWLTTHKTELEMMANSPTIAGGDKEAIINYLKQENERLKVYKGIFVSDVEGNWYSTTGATGQCHQVIIQYLSKIINKESKSI
jgi:methyl-accepting chemotaxis protein